MFQAPGSPCWKHERQRPRRAGERRDVAPEPLALGGVRAVERRVALQQLAEALADAGVVCHRVSGGGAEVQQPPQRAVGQRAVRARGRAPAEGAAGHDALPEHAEPRVGAEERRAGSGAAEAGRRRREAPQRPPFVLQAGVVGAVAGELDHQLRGALAGREQEQHRLARRVLRRRPQRGAVVLECQPGVACDAADVRRRAQGPGCAAADRHRAGAAAALAPGRRAARQALERPRERRPLAGGEALDERNRVGVARGRGGADLARRRGETQRGDRHGRRDRRVDEHRARGAGGPAQRGLRGERGDGAPARDDDEVWARGARHGVFGAQAIVTAPGDGDDHVIGVARQRAQGRRRRPPHAQHFAELEAGQQQRPGGAGRPALEVRAGRERRGPRIGEQGSVTGRRHGGRGHPVYAAGSAHARRLIVHASWLMRPSSSGVCGLHPRSARMRLVSAAVRRTSPAATAPHSISTTPAPSSSQSSMMRRSEVSPPPPTL